MGLHWRNGCVTQAFFLILQRLQHEIFSYASIVGFICNDLAGTIYR